MAVLHPDNPLKDKTVHVRANGRERHMTTGQRAMAIAMLSPEPEKGGRGKKGAISGKFSGVAHQRLSDARAVLAYSPELAEAVMRHGKKAPINGQLCGSPQMDFKECRSERHKWRSWNRRP